MSVSDSQLRGWNNDGMDPHWRPSETRRTVVRPEHELIKFFKYEHLPEKLQVISKPFGELARAIDATYPAGAETTTALRKLLEAKDCAVRAHL